MSDFVSVESPQAGQLKQLCQAIAAMIPALVISYSLLIDPLVNFNLNPGFEFGGVEFDHDRKSNALTKVAIPVFFAFSMILLLATQPKVPKPMRPGVLTGLSLIMLACLSAIWAYSPANTLMLALYQATLYGAILASVLAAGNPRLILKYVLYAFAIAVTINLLALVARPPGPDGHSGLYVHKNTLGAAMGLGFLFGLFGLAGGQLSSRMIAGYTMLGAAVLLVASASKTAVALAILGPLAAVVAYWLHRWMGLRVLATLALALGFCAPLLVIVALMLQLSPSDIMLLVFRDETFTGRTEIWAFAFDYIQQSPWIGNGFRGFWSLGDDSPKTGSEIEFIRTIGSGHSGFVDILLDLGVVGFVLLLTFVFGTIRLAGKFDKRPTQLSLLYLSVAFFVVGRNFTESVIMWSTFFDNLSFILVGFLAAYHSADRPGLAASREPR